MNFPSGPFPTIITEEDRWTTTPKETDVTNPLWHDVTAGLGRGLYPPQVRNTNTLESDGEIGREQAYAPVSPWPGRRRR